MPGSLFNRDIDINIGGTRIASRLLDETKQRLGPELEKNSSLLRVVFKIVKNLKNEPNSADVSIYNLNKDSRTKMQQKDVQAVIKAGYIGNIATIFSGELHFGENILDGTDWVTSFQASDGGKKHKSSRISVTFKGKTKITDVLKESVKSLGIDPGNLADIIKKGNIRSAIQEFQNGITLTGKAEQAVEKVANKLGYDFSVQDGQAIFLGPTDTVTTQVIKISPGSGMVGSPEAGEKGYLKVRCLLQPELLPGKRIQLDSVRASGFFRIDKAEFSGDTWGSEWFVDLECKPI